MVSKKKSSKKKPIKLTPPQEGKTTWSAQEAEASRERIKKLLEVVGCNTVPKFVPIEKLGDPGVRTITVVARSVSCVNNGEPFRYYMETGRMAAQAGHAVSNLKLAYVLCNNNDQTDANKFYTFTRRLYCARITNIILEARNEKELIHIRKLCRERGIDTVNFFDTNQKVYGSGNSVLTAIAIGPVHEDWVEGITDYLPLFAETSR